jgi:hypothetical protein
VVLDQFIEAPGGNINKEKINIRGRKSSLSLLEIIARILEFFYVPQWSSFKYLGIV